MIDTGATGGGFMGGLNRMAGPLNSAAQKMGSPRMRGMNKQIGAGMARPGGLGGPGMAHPNMQGGMPNMVQGPSPSAMNNMMGAPAPQSMPPTGGMGLPPNPIGNTGITGGMLGGGMAQPSGGMMGGPNSGFMNPNMASQLWNTYNNQSMPNANQQAPGLNKQIFY